MDNPATQWDQTAPSTLSFASLEAEMRDQIRIFAQTVEKDLKIEILHAAIDSRRASE